MNQPGFIKKTLGAALMAAMIFAGCSAPGSIPATGSTPDVGKLLENKSFTFVPQTASPVGSRTRQVTAEFFFRLSGDTVQSYLPYFGRSFSAPINTSRGGMDFTTTDFGYQVSQGRKDATVIVIEPRSGTDVRQINLQVFPNGNASLQALSNNRSTISYNGYIRAGRR